LTSLAYCANEVEAARDRWRHAVDAGREPGVDVGRAVDGLAESVRSARGLGPSASEVALRILGELGGGRHQTLAEVEPWLTAAESGLVAAIATTGPW
jgi:hypothetical protein